MAACEGAVGKAGDPGKAAGVPPQVTPIGDITLTAGQSAPAIDLSDHFNDPDGAAGATLTYTVASSNAAVASGSVTGGMLTVRASAVAGKAKLTVTATDAQKLTARAVVNVTVTAAPIPNQAPVAVGTIPEVDVQVGASDAVDVAAYFNDPDGDTLSYTAKSSDGDATVSVAGSVVTIVGKVVGGAIITVTASDPGKLSVDQTIEVDVAAAPSKGAAPQPLGSIMAVSLTAGEAGTPIDVSNYFHHPDGATMTYTVSSSAATVATASIPTGTSMLTITGQRPKAQATATVTVTASDPDGQTAKQQISVTVAADDTPVQPKPGEGPTAITLPKDTAEIDVDLYIPAGASSRDYRVVSTNTRHFSVALRTGSTSVWAITARQKTTTPVNAEVQERVSDKMIATIVVTITNRAPAIVSTTLPAIADMTKKDNVKANENGDDRDANPKTKDDTWLDMYAITIDPKRHFADKDADDTLEYKITSSREDVKVSAGASCILTSTRRDCDVTIDVIDDHGEGSFNLEVVASDGEAESKKLAFPVRMRVPLPQLYDVDQARNGFLPVTLGYRKARHKMEFRQYDKPPTEGADDVGLFFIESYVDGLAGTITMPGEIAATGTTDIVVVAQAPDTSIPNPADAPDHQIMLVLDGRAFEKATLSKAADPANPVLAMDVTGAGDGSITFTYYVYDDLDGDTDTGVIDPATGAINTDGASWGHTSATLKITVNEVK